MVIRFMNTVGDFTDVGMKSFLFTRVLEFAPTSAEYVTVDSDCNIKIAIVLIL